MTRPNLPAATTTRELTDMQAAFVRAFTSGQGVIGNAKLAAEQAGYSLKSSKDIGRQLLELVHVQEAIVAANKLQISGALASKAIEVLEGIVNDEKENVRIRLDAAKTILDRAGYIAPKAELLPPPPPPRPRSAAEWAEIRKSIDDWKAEQAERARQEAAIDITPEAALEAKPAPGQTPSVAGTPSA